MKVSFLYSDFCPYAKANRAIHIDSTEISPSLGYKKLGYLCEDSESCPHLDEYGRCPIFLKAPSEPR